MYCLLHNLGMPSYYETVASGGDNCKPQQAFVHLYPQSPVSDTCQDSGIVRNAMDTALNDLLNFGAIDYYEVLRFKTENNNDPSGVPIGVYDDTASGFKDYLQNNNGTGDNLYSRGGVHHLIHTDQNACDEDSEGYAPAGANAEAVHQTAFTNGLMAWSPACDANDSLTMCAAAQETLHEFTGHDENSPYVGEEEDEHSLGRVIDVYGTGHATPMIAYHWDDYDAVKQGQCPSSFPDDRFASDHIVNPTECTKKTVRDTADNEIDDNIRLC